MRVRGSYISAALIALAVVGWFVSDNFTDNAADAPTAEVATAEEEAVRNLTIKALAVRNETIPLQVRASGVTRTSFTLQVQSRREAVIRSLAAKEGSWVNKGDVLLTLDEGTLAADLDAARAERQAAAASYDDAKRRFSADGTLASQLSAAEADLEATRKNYTATVKLVEKGLQTDLTLASQRAQLRAAETRLFELQSLSQEKELSASYAALKAVDARIAALQSQLSYTVITAPQTGWVEDINVEIGELAKQNQAVVTMLGLQELILDVPVPQAQIGDIAIGDPAEITITGFGSLTGNVVQIAASANQATRTFNVEIALPNPDGGLRAGMSAEASITIKQTDAFKMSPAHLNVDANGQLTAKIVGAGDKVQTKAVSLVRTSGNLAYIAGLEDDMLVLAAGQAFLAEGESVRYVVEEANN